MKECWLCGANGSADPLDRHHIFGGANRQKSERYGLVVLLCHSKCHIFGKDAAHQSADTAQLLHEYGQKKWMDDNKATVDDFRKEFGRSYVDEE